MRSHLEKRARRHDPKAIALLRAPDFPSCFGYLFDWFAELLLFCDDRPTWREIQPWAATMSHTLSSWELRSLRRISDAYFASQVTDGD